MPTISFREKKAVLKFRGKSAAVKFTVLNFATIDNVD